MQWKERSNYTANGEQVENTNLKSGLYVVRVVKGGNTMTKKVLVK
ncbi:T9SS type A sorting domain-containing protein [Prevotella pectinovora]|nr:T9SS type A sorting domain-containing protein [Prevotella pectinovora]